MKITIPRNLTPVPHARRTDPVDPDRRIELHHTDLRAKFKALKEAQKQEPAPNVCPMQKRRNSSARGL